MRSENEMLELILGTAKEDERIRAVYMNGSRVNPNVKKDCYQDYDIVYVVKETKSFYQEENWIDRFGEILSLQMPERMDKMRGLECHWEDTYGWLMLFTDGNRIDLHVNSIPFAQKEIGKDRLCRILLDKDGILPEISESTDEDYWVRKPAEADFLCECNNFWWCLNNVAKGIAREEISYVMDMINYEIRPCLEHMISWSIGVEYDFTVSVGKSGKFLPKFLSEERYQNFLSTYSDADTEHLWQAVFVMCDLFHETAMEAVEKLNIIYNQKEENGARRYLRMIQQGI